MSVSGVFDKTSYMRALVMSTRSIAEPVPVTPFADWDYYYTNASLDWKPDQPETAGHGNISVPKGFVTDLASIPRLFWTIFPPAAAYSYPAIIHDYLYWFQPCSRETADNILKL